jgi:hypothetical protein
MTSLQCALGAISMSALGQKLPRRLTTAVPALPPKADRNAARRRVRFGPETDIPYVGRLLRVVENDADGVPQAATDAAYAVPEIDAIVAFRALDRPVVHGEGHRVALP